MPSTFSAENLLLSTASGEDDSPANNSSSTPDDTKQRKHKRTKKRKSSSDQSSSGSPVVFTGHDALKSHLNNSENSGIADEMEYMRTDSMVSTEKESSLHEESQARYFSGSNVICSNCGLLGHVSLLCSEEPIGKRCFLCGDEGHIARDCPQELCHNCLRPGHKRRDCTLPRRTVGVDESQLYPCFDELENVEELRCYLCAKRGHLDCSYETLPFSKIISCYNCGQHKHAGWNCHKPSADEYLSVANKLTKVYSKPRRRNRQRDLEEESVLFTEKVEDFLNENRNNRRLSLQSSNKKTKQSGRSSLRRRFSEESIPRKRK